MIEFPPARPGAVRAVLPAYVRQLPGPGDELWEEGLLASRLYEVAVDGRSIGVIGLRDGALSLFIVPGDAAREALLRARETFAPNRVYVPMGDPRLLALCREQGGIAREDRLFFTPGAEAVRPPKFPAACFRRATSAEESALAYGQDIRADIRLGRLFVLREGDAILGQGFLRRNYLSARASLGMVAHSGHRRRGVGRSLLLHLQALCRQRGLQPVCACRPENRPAQAALRSAGFERVGGVWVVRGGEGNDAWSASGGPLF